MEYRCARCAIHDREAPPIRMINAAQQEHARWVVEPASRALLFPAWASAHLARTSRAARSAAPSADAAQIARPVAQARDLTATCI